MSQYFGPDLAFDLVKGLVAGGASLALQAVAPSIFRALKRIRARWLARKNARKAGHIDKRLGGRLEWTKLAQEQEEKAKADVVPR